MARMFQAIVVIAVVFAALAGGYLRLAYGGGRPAPNVLSTPLLPTSALETVLTFEQPIGDVAVGPDGSVFFTVHPAAHTIGPRLYQWRDGAVGPFPSAMRQGELFVSPAGVFVDAQARVWVVDHGDHGRENARLYAFAAATGEVLDAHRFDAETAPPGSYLTDVAVSPDGAWAYIADASVVRRSPGIIVYDVERGHARRAMDGQGAVRAEPLKISTPTRDMIFVSGLAELRFGVNGLAVSDDGAAVFFGAGNGSALYQAPGQVLRSIRATSDEVAAAVRAVGPKPLSGSLTIDASGGVIAGDIEHGAIVRIRLDGEVETLVDDPGVRWPGGLATGPGGWVYIGESAVQDVLFQSPGAIRAAGPYRVLRIRPPADGATNGSDEGETQ